MSGFREPDQFSSDETADAVLAAGESATAAQLTTVAAAQRRRHASRHRGHACRHRRVFQSLRHPAAACRSLSRLFHASKSEVGRTVSAATLGVALSAPFCGALAERVGRRKVIVLSIFLLALPTILAATAHGPCAACLLAISPRHRDAGNLWRHHRLHRRGVAAPPRAAGHVDLRQWHGARWFSRPHLYRSRGHPPSHSVCRAQLAQWIRRHRRLRHRLRISSLALAAARLAPAATVPEIDGGFARHLRNPQLLATFAVGFNVLFTLVATFTYVTFYLAAPPFGFSPAQLSALFMVYLVGLVITPLGGIWISRVGSRAALIDSVVAGIVGVLLTLVPNLAGDPARSGVCAPPESSSASRRPPPTSSAKPNPAAALPPRDST